MENNKGNNLNKNGDNDIYHRPISGLNSHESDSSDLDQSDQDNKFKKFCKRHLHAIVAVAIVILTLIILFIVDRNLRTVHLTLPTDGLSISYQANDREEQIKTDTPVRLLSYNADLGAPNELLYYTDIMAIADPDSDTLHISWKVPDEARYRSTYSEICLLDSDKENKNIDGYCKSVEGSSNNTTNAVYVEASTTKPDKYNKVSCSYYVSAHSVGLLATVSGWNRLSEDQFVGCAGSAKKNNASWGDESYMNAAYGFYNDFKINPNGGLVPNTSISGLTMENLFQSLINSNGGDMNAGDVINNSLTDNFTYNRNTQQIDLSPTGVLAGQSCNINYSRTYSRPAPVNGSDNSTTQTYSCIPVFSVDKYGRIVSVSTRFISYDAVSGNEVVGAYGMHSGLTRHGAGTAEDPYTLSVNVNKGLLIDDHNNIEVNIGGWYNNGRHSGLEFSHDGVLRINAPEECNNVDNTVLGWNDEEHEFSCITFADNYGIDKNYQNTVITRTGDTIDYNLGVTGVMDSNDNYYADSHTPSADDDAKDVNAGSTFESDIEKITYQIPRFTVDKYGRFLSAGTTDAFTLSVGSGMNMDKDGNISIDQGIGLIMLCPINPTNLDEGYKDGNDSTCHDSDRQLVINIGGDNNTGTGSGNSGLTINSNKNLSINPGRGVTINTTNNTVEVNYSDGLTFDDGGKLKINSPTCDVPGENEDKQVLSWNGSAFVCRSGTDFNIAAQGTIGSQNIGDNDTVTFQNGTNGGGLTATRDGNDIKYEMNDTGVAAGIYNASRNAVANGVGITVPQFTVNAQGQLTSANSLTTTLVTGGKGITIDSNGAISLNGLEDHNTAYCNSPGQGLSWTGSGFSCTTAYSWNLTASGANSSTISNGNTVNFNASNGLTVSKSGNSIAYAIDLSNSRGLVFNNGSVALPNCYAKGYVLKWNGSAYTCEEDEDSLAHECTATGVVRDIVSTDAQYNGDYATVTTSSGFTLGSVAQINFTLTWAGEDWESPSTANKYVAMINESAGGCNFKVRASGTGLPFTGTIITGGFSASITGGVRSNGSIRFDEWVDVVAAARGSAQASITSGSTIQVTIMYITRK